MSEASQSSVPVLKLQGFVLLPSVQHHRPSSCTYSLHTKLETAVRLSRLNILYSYVRVRWSSENCLDTMYTSSYLHAPRS